MRYSQDNDDPRAELLLNSNVDIEEPKSETQNGRLSSPPSYFGQSEALSYQMKRLETKIDQLDILHKKHLDRPTLDDQNEEEAQINSATKDVCDVSKINASASIKDETFLRIPFMLFHSNIL